MVWGSVDVVAEIAILIYPVIAGLSMGFVNEKLAKGSILPSWFIHGTLNTIEALLQAF